MIRVLVAAGVVAVACLLAACDQTGCGPHPGAPGAGDEFYLQDGQYSLGSFSDEGTGFPQSGMQFATARVDRAAGTVTLEYQLRDGRRVRETWRIESSLMGSPR